ncbi:PadR family transcriptional regulator [Bacillus toyonensis]|uniref:PadR family transcriptional regulator n=1 Tax=Bacillus toyonensis TaxID=155322 RepID=UPI000BEC2C1C|nr:PadR family transcriptional regulator [Bacillus toyonensis]MED2846657.1 PadR family transcriptional regulator [Bacillus toyonensis]PDZ26441.1 PadR family transcriptional regulator [Bacillus toyonensis]PGB38768.1 PadR family transcriptional regulator [Bacillus toyonensis]PGB86942.1 PadR family transcriptional regulator [Bacillus toyonensis]PHC92310.1 PadR family transcriptional regulator [Bacillus toyonensis]
MGIDLQDVKFFIETPDGEKVEIKATQDVSIISDKVVDSDFGIGGEINGTFTWEEPENVKELKERGFTDQQAWNIHLRKGESWKEN